MLLMSANLEFFPPHFIVKHARSVVMDSSTTFYIYTHIYFVYASVPWTDLCQTL